MERIVLLSLLLPVLVLGASFSGPLTLNTQSPPVYSKLEISFSLGNSYSNPYDTSAVEVNATFAGPSGISSVIGCFPFQQYTTSSSNNWNPTGPLHWLCRLTPMEIGSYKYVVSAGDSAGHATSSGTFTSVNSSLPGFIHRSSVDDRFLIRSNTKQSFFAIGENIAWYTSGIHDYDNWVGKVAAAGGNYFRVWIGATGWSFAIEEKQLGDYSSTQQMAAWLDYLIEMAEQKGMTIMLCFNYHGDFSTQVNSNWGKNPYNVALGGPLSDPSQVWTNTEARMYFERRYRYIIARWGYSTAVHAWELWNEMDWIDNFANDVSQAAAWHQYFYTFIHQFDPFRHVITASFAEDHYNQQIDAILDFTQIHQYSIPDFVTCVQGYVPTKVSQYNKPDFLGEMGVSWESGQDSINEDPTGISLHNVQWASLVFGGAGGGFSWWWDSYIDPKNLYYRYTGISQFLTGESLDSHQYQVVQPTLSSSNLRSWALSGNDGHVLGWVQAGAHTWSNMNNGGSVPTVNSPAVKLSCANKVSNNTLEIWNTVSGTRISYSNISCSDGLYTFQLPTINGNNPDYAFKIYAGGPQNHTNSLLPDWAFCSDSSQCQDGCCSKQYSSDGQLKCTPGGSPDQCVHGGGGLLPDWSFCNVSSQCQDGCCSKQYSSDGKLKCTPGGSPDQCVNSGGNNLPDWSFCSSSSQCTDGCCSKQYSNDGQYKCTPGGTPSQCM